MKKYMTVALAAIATAAFAAVGIAQTTETHTMDVKVTPTDAGTKKKPKNGTVEIFLQAPQTKEVTVDKFTYFFPSNLRVSTKGFKRCSPDQIADNGNVPPAKCNKAKVGGGTAIAYVGGRQGTKYTFDTTLFANRGSLTVYVIAQENPNLKQAFPATFEDGPAGYGQALVADVPKNLEFPVPNVPAILDTVDLQLGPKSVKKTVRRKGKKRRVVYRLVSVRGCATDQTHTVGTRLDYSDDPRNADPAPAATETSDTTPCTK